MLVVGAVVGYCFLVFIIFLRAILPDGIWLLRTLRLPLRGLLRLGQVYQFLRGAMRIHVLPVLFEWRRLVVAFLMASNVIHFSLLQQRLVVRARW